MIGGYVIDNCLEVLKPIVAVANPVLCIMEARSTAIRKDLM